MPFNILPGKLLLKNIQGVVVILGKMGHIDWHGIPLDSHPLKHGLFIYLSARKSELNFRARVTSLMLKA